EIVVEPRFFRRARYNALLTVILVVALADVFGIVGLILGPPLAALVQIIGRHLMLRQLARQRGEAALPAPNLDERLVAVRAALASRQNPPAELVNLANRVEALV